MRAVAASRGDFAQCAQELLQTPILQQVTTGACLAHSGRDLTCAQCCEHQQRDLRKARVDLLQVSDTRASAEMQVRDHYMRLHRCYQLQCFAAVRCFTYDEKFFFPLEQGTEC